MSEALYAQIDNLKEQVAYWKGLAGDPADSLVSDLIYRGFTSREGQMLGALYAKPGPVRSAAIVAIIWGHNPPSTIKAIKVYVWALRKKLGHDAIDTIWGVGVSLTDAGRTKVRALLEAPPSSRLTARHGRVENVVRG